MRLTIATLRRVVKGDLTIQFVSQALTTYGGLELLGRYLRQVDLRVRLRQAVCGNQMFVVVYPPCMAEARAFAYEIPSRK